jgi:hypothetical protein
VKHALIIAGKMVLNILRSWIIKKKFYIKIILAGFMFYMDFTCLALKLIVADFLFINIQSNSVRAYLTKIARAEFYFSM